jgi:hypothetical protein
MCPYEWQEHLEKLLARFIEKCMAGAGNNVQPGARDSFRDDFGVARRDEHVLRSRYDQSFGLDPG